MTSFYVKIIKVCKLCLITDCAIGVRFNDPVIDVWILYSVNFHTNNPQKCIKPVSTNAKAFVEIARKTRLSFLDGQPV